MDIFTEDVPVGEPNHFVCPLKVFDVGELGGGSTKYRPERRDDLVHAEAVDGLAPALHEDVEVLVLLAQVEVT